MELQTESQLETGRKQTSLLREIILGGQDGLVNVLGLSLGLFAAHAQNRIILIAGLAAGLSEAISMGAVAYTSSLAERDFYAKSRKNAYDELTSMPALERANIYEIYRAKGFDGEILDKIVDHICSDKKLWMNTIVSEDLHLQPIETKGLLSSSVIVGVAALIGALIPLVPFLGLSVLPAIVVSICIGAVVLFSVGAYKAYTLVGVWWKSGLQMLLIGICSAFAGFFIGLLLKVG